jgi:hypothetical protein
MTEWPLATSPAPGDGHDSHGRRMVMQQLAMRDD